MRFLTKFVAALLIGFADHAIAQIVVEDVAKWTQKECRWLHSQVLAECENQQTCSASPKKLDLSMSSQRGIPKGSVRIHKTPPFAFARR